MSIRNPSGCVELDAVEPNGDGTVPLRIVVVDDVAEIYVSGKNVCVLDWRDNLLPGIVRILAQMKSVKS